jgi:hypothetical protein
LNLYERTPSFEISPASEMRAKYGLYAENRPLIRLEPSAVPPALQHLIPLAEQFGIGDDLIRTDLVAKTPGFELAKMRQSVESLADEFDAWLAGPEAQGPDFSREYLAFTCLRMAADGV